MMRYCSARKINPAAVDEVVLDAYMRYRAETTSLASGDDARRSIARAWNGCIGVVEGWPERRLIEPSIKPMEGPAWEEFPEGLEGTWMRPQRAHPRPTRRQGQPAPAM